MKVRNVEPRLICVGGQFIAPNQVADVNDKAAGLEHFLARGILVIVESDKKPAKEETPKALAKQA